MRSNGYHNSTNAPPTDTDRNSQRMHAGLNNTMEHGAQCYPLFTRPNIEVGCDGVDGFDVRKKLKFVKNEEEVLTFISTLIPRITLPIWKWKTFCRL